ncbi:MAG: hypothetical protein SFW35_05545 [Chitinophagales bacterium]|nr:hypothetical protein [Chitinophagales bacterium]
MDGDYYNDISNKVTDTLWRKFQRVAISTLVYVIAYILVGYALSYLSGLIAMYFNFHPEIKYYGLYKMPVAPNLWTNRAVLGIYGLAPFLIFVIGIVFYQITNSIQKERTIYKVFTLWIAIHCFCLFFSLCITASFGTQAFTSPFYYGLAVATTWLHMDPVLIAPVSLGALLALIFLGIYLVRNFLALSYARPVAFNFNARRLFVIEIAIIPWLIGTILTTLISVPPNHYPKDLLVNLGRNGAFAIMILGMIFKLDHPISHVVAKNYNVFNRPMWPFLLGVLALFFLIKRHYISYLISSI